MRIGELAARTEVSVRVLRYYETQGLIQSRRLPNGYRDYALNTVERVQWVVDLLGCGFGTRQIREFLPCLENGISDPEQCAAKHLAKMRELDTMIDLLTERRRRLSERLTQLTAAAPGETG